MRSKIVLLLSFLAFLAMDVNSKQLETEATLREIQIKSTERLMIRSNSRSASLNASVTTIAPAAFVMGEDVAVIFSSKISNVAIVVTNAETGEVVYQDLFSCAAPTTVMLPLSGCESGEYVISMTTTSTTYSGEFTL